jgi:IS605 OrfB family transposase
MSTLPTQRAYTLRLHGFTSDDLTWRDSLWRTHVAVNRGVKAFGNWLLTLRGGLCHTLVDAAIPDAKGKPARAPTKGERRHRRIILALSWLSVESHETEHDAPAAYFVAVRDGVPQTIEALREILENRGVVPSEIADWVRDCGDSLRAGIRESAVWVNRSRAFDDAVRQVVPSLTRAEIWDFLGRFIKGPQAYFGAVANDVADDIDKNSVDTNRQAKELSGAANSERPKDSKLAKEANQWLRDRFGTGKGADFSDKAREYEAFASWCRRIVPERSPDELLADLKASFGVTNLPRRLAATPGESNSVQIAYQEVVQELQAGSPPSRTNWDRVASMSDDKAAEKMSKVGNKGRREWTQSILADVEQACEIKYLDPDDGTQRGWEYCVMLDHAARRVSQVHSWIKLAEAERNKFEKDARTIDRLKQEHPEIVEWLDQFCHDRSRETGTAEVDGYRIRKRAISDWSEVVTRWGSPKCKTVDDRIAAAAEVQANPENDKPGDHQLYKALAQDDANLVWFVDGKPDAQPLKDYVAAREAEHSKRHFKVPAYRHPDELRHPVFCDFGESRWSIDFAVHRVGSKRQAALETVERRQTAVTRARSAIEKAKTDEKRNAEKKKLTLAEAALAKEQHELNWLQSRNGLRMKLWDGHTVQDRPLTWRSKRLRNELLPAVPADSEAPRTPVSRVSRLARAAANANGDSKLEVAGLLGCKHWNGRLQAPRAELNRIADIRDGRKGNPLSPAERDACVARMIARLHWFVTYSAQLRPQGPWLDYAASHPGLVKPATKDWPHKVANTSREGRAKLILPRLPNLRILSVDLGHRYAAACAVWEAIPTKELHAACQLVEQAAPSRNDRFWSVPRGGGQQGRVVYRRIADDTLSDGSPHPAPWARLDRQFLIKLPGEDERARQATNGERSDVKSLERELGYQRREQRTASGWRIDELMLDVARTVRLALRKHGDYARIASGLIATERPGMGNNPPVKLKGDTLVEHLVGLLDLWHQLAKSSHWLDEFAGQLWDSEIETRLNGVALQDDTDEMTGTERKAARAARRNQLRGVAGQLAGESRVKLCAAWEQAWAKNDEQWPKRLRWLNRWIMPRDRKKDRSIRQVGGLSLNRIATFKLLYRVQKAFFTRQKPDGRKPNPAGAAFGQRTLTGLERMHENRVKQLASRIVEAALGVGVEQSRTKQGKQRQRPRERIANARFAPCHAVVIENLTHYRPDELQTRRENRQLMTWASAQVKKHLTDQCELHGLHLREVQPGYTSRQDFRTGAPGVRCVDVPRAEFIGTDGTPGRHVRQAIKSLLRDQIRRAPASIPDWPARLELARANARAGSGTAWDRYVIDLFDHLAEPIDLPEGKADTRFARIPQKGGDIFVPAGSSAQRGETHGPPGVQADLNAAGNIGLKALLDPDWHGAWWYIPAALDADGWRVPNETSTTGAACLKEWRVGEADAGVYRSAANGGRALTLSDDQQVQDAAKRVRDAKEKLDAAKSETRRAKRGKSTLTHDGALELAASAKAAHEEARKNDLAARKGARAKAVVNLWRFLSDQRPGDCDWREYASYDRLVRCQVIERLRKVAGLTPAVESTELSHS